jgi:histidinol-phosphate phosphatase family protein
MKQLPTLFLDRDGVLNVRTPDDYVKTQAEWIPVSGLEKSMQQLSAVFGRIVVVTNQAGIGKGLMSEADLAEVHRKMLDIIESAGGRIDAIYYCPHRREEGCNCRKPATGMALRAKVDFPDIDFTNSWIAGDSISDMEFGLKLGMKTVLIHGKAEEAERLAEMPVDYRFYSLADFATVIPTMILL